MTSTQIALLVIVVIAVVAVAALLILQNRTKKLRARFGPEYDRAVAETGNKFKAEAQLEKVEKRVSQYPLRPLTAADRDRFQQLWRAIQAKFVDDPAGAFVEADQLLGAVMSARGYPPTDFDESRHGNFRGSRHGCRGVPGGARHRDSPFAKAGQHGRSAKRHGSLPRAIRRIDAGGGGAAARTRRGT